ATSRFTRFGLSRRASLIALAFIMAVNLSFATGASAGMAGEVGSDFKYVTNNALLDVADIATSPLYIASDNSPLFAPKFYLVLAGAGALWGGSYALDQTMRSHLRSMSGRDADLLQDLSYSSVSASTALLYGYGLWYEDARARYYALNAGEGAGISSLLAIAFKAGFGRLRPRQSSSHTAFFHGGQSFVSGDVAPMFALASGVSEYFHNEWYVAAPVYSLSLLDGFGRMGHDDHWFSDVVGAALLGIGTTELLIWLHKRHDQEPNRWRLFAMSEPGPTLASSQPFASLGIGIAYNW
ncbi:MAG TPA: phosphatase PAP2 family protein, partial [Candidatus Binataceae bacterium]|nr:phosphatase PAP2 family protein [Candidatus Binataceae bacterium]